MRFKFLASVLTLGISLFDFVSVEAMTVNNQEKGGINVRVDSIEAPNNCVVSPTQRNQQCPASHNHGGGLQYQQTGVFNCSTEQWVWTDNLSSMQSNCYRVIPAYQTSETKTTTIEETHSCDAKYQSGSDDTEHCLVPVGWRWDLVSDCKAENSKGHDDGCIAELVGKKNQEQWRFRLKNYTKDKAKKYSPCDKYGNCVKYTMTGTFSKLQTTTKTTDHPAVTVYYPN